MSKHIKLLYFGIALIVLTAWTKDCSHETRLDNLAAQQKTTSARISGFHEFADSMRLELWPDDFSFTVLSWAMDVYPGVDSTRLMVYVEQSDSGTWVVSDTLLDTTVYREITIADLMTRINLMIAQEVYLQNQIHDLEAKLFRLDMEIPKPRAMNYWEIDLYANEGGKP